jgi:iron(III) transport system substrate-binding protein
MVIPSDGAGYELEASALMKAAKNKADAKRFLDWTLSSKAAALYTSYKEMVTIAGTPASKAAQAAGFPADVQKAIFPIDFARSAKERDGILKTWQTTIGR